MSGPATYGALLMVLMVTVAEAASAQAAQAGNDLARSELAVVISQNKYDSAAVAHDLALDSLNLATERFSAALLALGAARASADEDRQEAASAAALAPGREWSIRVSNLQIAKQRLTDARRDLIRTLVAWQNELQQRAASTTDITEQNRYGTLYESAGERISQLETFEDEPPMPGLALVESDPRDGPDEWRYKASLCRRLAEEGDTLLAELSSDLGELEVRQRMNRQRDDFLRDTRRFGGIAPLATPDRRQDGVQVADTTSGAEPLAMTLEERINELKGQISQVEDYRDRLLERAAEFEELLGGGIE